MLEAAGVAGVCTCHCVPGVEKSQESLDSQADVLVKRPKRKKDEMVQCAQRTPGTGAGSGAAAEQEAWRAPNMLDLMVDELKLSKDDIRAEVDLLVDQGWCTESQGDIEDLLEETMKMLNQKEHTGLRQGGKVVLNGEDVRQVMVDLWKEEQENTMWVTSNTTGEEVMDFLMPSAAPLALSEDKTKRKAGENTMAERLEDDAAIG